MLQQPIKSGACRSHSYFSFRCGTKAETVSDADQIYSIFTVIKKQGEGVKKLMEQKEEIQAYNLKKVQNYDQTKRYTHALNNDKALGQNPAKNNKKQKKLKTIQGKELVLKAKNPAKINKKRSAQVRKSTLSLKPKGLGDKSKEKKAKEEVLIGSAIDYFGDAIQNKRQTMTTIRSQESRIRELMKSQIHLKKKFSLPSDQYNDIGAKEPTLNMKKSMEDPVSSYFRRIIDMNQKHNQQAKKASHLNEKQMRRLLKIHEIEKQKLKQQLQQFINQNR